MRSIILLLRIWISNAITAMDASIDRKSKFAFKTALLVVDFGVVIELTRSFLFQESPLITILDISTESSPENTYV